MIAIDINTYVNINNILFVRVGKNKETIIKMVSGDTIKTTISHRDILKLINAESIRPIPTTSPSLANDLNISSLDRRKDVYRYKFFTCLSYYGVKE